MKLGIRSYIIYGTGVWILFGGFFHTLLLCVDPSTFFAITSKGPPFPMDFLVWFAFEGMLFGTIIWLAIVIASLAKGVGAVKFPIIFGIVYGGVHGLIFFERWFLWGFFAYNDVSTCGPITRLFSGIIAGLLSVIATMFYVVDDIENERRKMLRRQNDEEY